jgi:alpha-beta hydrolase superfamily lysophospholipase
MTMSPSTPTGACASTNSTPWATRNTRTAHRVRPLNARFEGASVEAIPFYASDGTQLALNRIVAQPRQAAGAYAGRVVTSDYVSGRDDSHVYGGGHAFGDGNDGGHDHSHDHGYDHNERDERDQGRNQAHRNGPASASASASAAASGANSSSSSSAVAPTIDDRPVVLLLHGHTASADMFVLPETRNMVDVLLDAGYEPWLLDWRGSCRLPYNETSARFSYDDVALYDLPEAVAYIRSRIGGRQLFVVAHCIGAMCLSMSMSAGLVPGLAAVVAQGVFLTPKVGGRTRVRMHLGGELLRTRYDHVPIDIRKTGLWSKYTPLFAIASRGADCADPTCQMLHNSAWGMSASLFVHDNLDERTHDRLAELFGPVPVWSLPHMRRIELAHTMMRWNHSDQRYRALPENALDSAGRIDAPLMLLSGSQNKLWYDSNKLCYDILTSRHPELDVRYVEVPGYGHVDTFIGRSAALDVFGHIIGFLDQHRTTSAV